MTDAAASLDELVALVERLKLEIDVLTRGAPADVGMVKAIAQVWGDRALTCREIALGTAGRPDLRQAIDAALPSPWSARTLGRRLARLEGLAVQRVGGTDREGIVWKVMLRNR